MHVRADALARAANDMLKATGRHPYCTSRWAKAWLSRHKEHFHCKKASTRTAARKAVQDRSEFEAWFAKYRQIKLENGIVDDNEWNADESGFRIGVLRGHYVWTYTDIDKPILTDPANRELVTTMEAVSAAGRVIPAFVIIPGTNLVSRLFNNNLEDDTVVTATPNAYMDDQTALEWIEHFVKHTQPAIPSQKRLLLMDNHGSHLTHEFFRIAKQARIILFPLPPSTTHKLQPLDVGVFQIYKHNHQKHLRWKIQGGAIDYVKSDFLSGLRRMREQTMVPRIIRSAWAKCGLVPFRPAVVLDALEDPLSSALNPEAIRTKPGYIPPLELQTSEEEVVDLTLSQEEEEEEEEEEDFAPGPQTPVPEKYINWSLAATPPLDLRWINDYSKYVHDRISSCIVNSLPVSPTITRVIQKRDKALQAMALVGAQATEELKRLKKNDMERERLKADNRLITRIGPICAGDARLRAATDEHSRAALKLTEAERLAKNEKKLESAALHRWLRETKASQRKEIDEEKRRLRTTGHSAREAIALVQHKVDQLSDIDWLLTAYREERRRRHDQYIEAVQQERNRLAIERGRGLESVPMPWNVAMPKLRPVTPWKYSDLVEEVIQGFKESGNEVKSEELLTGNDVIEEVDEEVVVVD
jgi:hypothetical protein